MSKRSKKNNKYPANSLLLPDITVKPLNREGASKLKASNSENNLKKCKPLKPSLSIKSWSVNQKYAKNKIANNLDDDNLNNFQDLNISNESDDYDCSSNLLRAKDSLENLLKTERFLENAELNVGSPSTSSSPETLSPRSLPALNEGATKSTAASKSSAWESKMTKNRRTKERKKKGGKTTDFKLPKCDNRDFKSGDDEKAAATSSNNLLSDNFAFVAYEPKTSRSVVFTNEVMVVYFNGEHVISESKEPLKKELEQQVRNKEMRKGHLLYN
ncbi:uncharacterized protein LOC123680223 isoform X1 [Harmonia axyridis]|uniref:uncharacterized protein LOC123680223 isoform X1 n=1 Tax=Harmonia axyridis TaxID=115357 RepID=UPI001E27875C|nr:uncharacterized protein LOC123680223 isoform X1 [Harmonia axyridis]